MIAVRKIISSLISKVRKGKRAMPLPSLVRALDRLVPRSVLREVVASSNDRRQWGVLAAAWVGVSEKEFTLAAAQELKVDYHERVPVPELPQQPQDARALLAALRKVGVVPVMEGGSIVRFIAVDPAEVRALPMYDGSVPIGLGAWSDIARALDAAERRVIEDEALQDQSALERRTKLSESLIETIVHEAATHGARSVEIVSSEDRARYQFTTRDGRCGVGNIRQDVIGDITTFLSRYQGSCFVSPKRGEVLVRSLGATGNVRLSWGELETTRPQLPSSLPPPSTLGPVAAELPGPKSQEMLPAPVNEDGVVEVPHAARGSESPRGGRLPVLVVDDNPMFCRVLERLLERDGFEPHFAPNGSVAWERLSNASGFKPRAVVCDLHMPLMNGQELLDRVRGQSWLSEVPFIMLTSDDDVDAELALLARGADAFVSKAKDPRVLCAHIRRLSQRVALQEAA
jgi:CheY-like chemotaxis protein